MHCTCVFSYTGFDVLFFQMDVIVLCTIQKKKQKQKQQEQQQSKEACKAGETKKRAIDRKEKGKVRMPAAGRRGSAVQQSHRRRIMRRR